MQIDIYLLATTEGVSPCDTQAQLWSYTSNGARIEVGLNVEVPGLVEYTVERQVESIASQGIARGESEISHREESHGVNLTE